MEATLTPFCVGCKRFAADIPELAEMAELEAETPEQYARSDGTYNRRNGHFLCDQCYVAAGCPTPMPGWKAP